MDTRQEQIEQQRALVNEAERIVSDIEAGRLDPNVPDASGNYPIFTVIESGKVSLVNRLLANEKLDLTVQNPDDQTPAQYSAQRKKELGEEEKTRKKNEEAELKEIINTNEGDRTPAQNKRLKELTGESSTGDDYDMRAKNVLMGKINTAIVKEGQKRAYEKNNIVSPEAKILVEQMKAINKINEVLSGNMKTLAEITDESKRALKEKELKQGVSKLDGMLKDSQARVLKYQDANEKTNPAEVGYVMNCREIYVRPVDDAIIEYSKQSSSDAVVMMSIEEAQAKARDALIKESEELVKNLKNMSPDEQRDALARMTELKAEQEKISAQRTIEGLARRQEAFKANPDEAIAAMAKAQEAHEKATKKASTGNIFSRLKIGKDSPKLSSETKRLHSKSAPGKVETKSAPLTPETEQKKGRAKTEGDVAKTASEVSPMRPKKFK